MWNVGVPPCLPRRGRHLPANQGAPNQADLNRFEAEANEEISYRVKWGCTQQPIRDRVSKVAFKAANQSSEILSAINSKLILRQLGRCEQ